MNTVTAVRNRILQLCNERNITINALATISGLPPSSIKNIIYGKSLNPKIVTINQCPALFVRCLPERDTAQSPGARQKSPLPQT